ncbi:twin-arginine translocase subunit TatC [Filibacter tadaridae]|uniref:Sec-independent protein translocase protein TatC n=1 Tax=Filibacter tadaridae TaxID=2483811 RepID=A0A3P5WYG6_9BACL|nr:twin-arginine translocase subunit TatC [Filibacter tadaridae]VDC21077.1 Sec-independent protein translocase protein TatCd [Filibacter tadaridae]
MDPYGDHNRKILSPLDKVLVEKKKKEVPVEPEDVTIKGETERVTTESEIEKIEPISEDSTGDGSEDDESLVGHLTDLRKQLIKSAGVFLFFIIAVFSTINLWFPFITRGHELIVLGPLEVIKFYMLISTALALGMSLPFLCHFLWQFLKPGLNKRESQFLSLYSPLMFLLFVGGLAFGYFVVNPISYNFLVALGSVNFNVMVSAQEYARFLLMTTVPLGLLFELPIVAMFLAAIGVLTADSMKKVRKWSYLSLAIVSALITPPDFVSQLIVLIPMAILYEASIFIVRRAERRSAVAN